MTKNKTLFFKPEDFNKIILACAIIEFFKNNNDDDYKGFVVEEKSISLIPNELNEKYNHNLLISNAFSHLKTPVEVFTKTTEMMLDYHKQIVEQNIFFTKQDFNFSGFEKDSYFKYVSDLAPYLYQFFNNKISFVSRDTFDDIFDCEFVQNKQLLQHTRILSLSKDKNIDLLWGLYANKFHGFCFEYSGKAIINGIIKKNVPIACFSKVEYDNKPKDQSIDLVITDKNLKEKMDDVLQLFIGCFCKNKSWEHQAEYRFMIFDTLFNKDFESLECKPSGFFTYDLSKKEIKGKHKLKG